MTTQKKVKTFTSVEFLTADEKAKIYNAWIKFLNSGFSKSRFTKALYEHLHLHCGYIAHYDINGFYTEYFNGDLQDKQRFFETLENNSWGDYKDITDAMIEAYHQQKDEIFSEAQEENNDKFELLKELVKRAETDIEFRNQILNKLFN